MAGMCIGWARPTDGVAHRAASWALRWRPFEPGGVRGKGAKTLLQLPFKLLKAFSARAVMKCCSLMW